MAKWLTFHVKSDGGFCGRIHQFTISEIACYVSPNNTVQAVFPPASSTAEANNPITIYGTCKPHTVQIETPSFLCTNGGESNVEGKCVCNPGFHSNLTDCNSM